MDDHDAPTDGAEPLSPAHDDVRRRLAEARHTDPIPADVAARLDRVLGELSDPRAEASVESGAAPPRAAPVVDLDARRRRRTATRVLVAAAAVVVAGVAVGHVLGSAGGSSSTNGSTVAGDRAESPEAGRANGSTAGSPPSSASAYDLGQRKDLHLQLAPLRLTTRSFDQQVQRSYDQLASPSNQSPQASSSGNDLNGASLPVTFDCAPADYGPGRLYAAYYDGVPAVLAFRPPAGSHRIAELLQCGTAIVVRSHPVG